MKSLKTKLLFLATIGLYLANCSIFKKEDKNDNATILGALALLQGCVLEGEITSDRTISGECTLKGVVTVKNGATLKLEPGTVVKGESKSLLVITQDGKIDAQGTSNQPIVFTSSKPEGSRTSADWGGLIIIGKAPIESVGSAPQTEGEVRFPYGDPSTNEVDHSSGILKYVRIEFAGGVFDTSGNDYNSLSLYAVGKGTKIEYIQTHMGRDDGVEIFGGRVEPKYLLITGAGDDDLDIDTGYFGTIENVLGYKYQTNVISNDPRGMELDGTDSTQTDWAALTTRGAGKYTVKNFTMIGQNSQDLREAIVRNCAYVTFDNGSFVGFQKAFETSTEPTTTCGPASTITCTNSIEVTQVTRNTTPKTIDTECTGGVVPTQKARNTIVSSDYNVFTYEKPTFKNENVKAFPGGTDWTQGWTYWRHN